MPTKSHPRSAGSKLVGISRDPRSGRWRAQIQLTLGKYDSPDEGAAIYLEAERLFRDQALELRRRIGDLRG
jgi:hypothetical protein